MSMQQTIVCFAHQQHSRGMMALDDRPIKALDQLEYAFLNVLNAFNAESYFTAMVLLAKRINRWLAIPEPETPVLAADTYVRIGPYMTRISFYREHEFHHNETALRYLLDDRLGGDYGDRLRQAVTFAFEEKEQRRAEYTETGRLTAFVLGG